MSDLSIHRYSKTMVGISFGGRTPHVVPETDLLKALAEAGVLTGVRAGGGIRYISQVIEEAK